jgi:hypothetical protein
MALLRRTGAVFAGLVVVVVLSTATDMVLHGTGVFPGGSEPMAGALFLLATAYRTAYGVAGGYVAARLAPDRPLAHAVVLGTIGLAVSIVGTVATWDKPEFGPHWYPLALAVLALPSSWAGGKLTR